MAEHCDLGSHARDDCCTVESDRTTIIGLTVSVPDVSFGYAWQVCGPDALGAEQSNAFGSRWWDAWRLSLSAGQPLDRR